MTHSGQGDERPPTAGPAHEGVVLPADGSEPWIPGDPGARTAPSDGQPWGEPWGPGQPGPEAARPGPGYGQGEYGAAGHPLPDAVPPHAAADATQYLPPVGADGGPPVPGASDATQYIPPVPGASDATQYIQPVPGASDATRLIPPVPPHAGPPVPGASDATQYIPPVLGASDATQYIQPVPGGGDATQYLPPVAPGALPPETAADAADTSRPSRPSRRRGSAAEPAVPPAPVSAPYGIRPGAPGDRPPPAEFDNLFRADAGGAAGIGPTPDSTQQMPRFDGGTGGSGGMGGSGGTGGDAAPASSSPRPGRGSRRRAPARRRRSLPVPLVAAVVVGCAIVGLGAGALVFGGKGDGDDRPKESEKVVAASPTPDLDDLPKPDDDPARPQAEALDRLLADSNNSRGAVIRSVEDIKRCDNLDRARDDLREAADQRRELVDRLEKLSVDGLPRHAELTKALTKAWKSSASADDDYAAWAKQVKRKKGCRDGKARLTKRSAEANRASGAATEAKREASAIWNSIAVKYRLTARGADQL
ncbi:hypothetical protein [Streptomyces sp. NPDC020965]|uniref:hypothetical protein n=1 Tax=Streptomyces sp. NPDC020965 TaxID=3365105 RepID=UPI0037A0EBC9